MLTMPTIDTIKRQARKEAWYGDSWNPFQKTGNRSKTWTSSPDQDIEAAGSRSINNEGPPLSAIQSEPAFRSRQYREGAENENIQRGSKEYEMTNASPAASNGKVREAESEETVVDRPTSRPRSQEEKARRRFLSRFSKDKSGQVGQVTEGEEPEKKRPWYKGKILPHKEPFTLRNQIQRTIFGSWVNILLIAAPVGIALNYAGVDRKAVFCVNFIAIIPLAGLLSFATEEIALHVGESLGGLLNASFGYVISALGRLNMVLTISETPSK